MNAVIYARFSSHNQTEQSIEGQLRVCHEFAQREGYNVVGEYIDRAITGRSDDRPDFQRMIDDARKKEFQFVIVYKLDRFARNRYDSAHYKHRLKQYGVKVISAMENIGDNPESIILEAVLEASAEYYSVDLSQKIKRGRRESALKGKYIGGGIPFGYKTIGGKLVLDEQKAPVMKEAFLQYAAGAQKKEIVDTINAKGFRNKKGKPFTNTAFTGAFKSRIYLGELSQGGIVTKDGCPALIDETTFEAVQQRISANKREGGRKKAKMEYLLSGKLYCGHCNSPMRGMSGTGRHGGKFFYYACMNRRLQKCDKKHEKKDFLEWYVCEQTVLYVLDENRIKEISRRVVEQYDKEFNDNNVYNLEKIIDRLERDIKNCVNAVVNMPAAGQAPLFERIEQLGMQKTDAEIDLAKLRIANDIRLKADDVETFLKQFCNGNLFDESYRRQLIDTFINSIYLFDDKVIIYYNVSGGKQVSYIEMLDDTELEDIIEDTLTDNQKGVRILIDAHHQSDKNTNHRFIFSKGLFGIIIKR